MKVKVIGIGQRHAGTGKTSGKPYDISNFYCTYSTTEVLGEKTEEITYNHLSGITLPDIQIGDIINVSYDKKGYLEEIIIIEKNKTPQVGNLKLNS
jgi:hypothetical protein